MEAMRIEPRDDLWRHVFGFAHISRGRAACIGNSPCGGSDFFLFQVGDMNVRKWLAAVASSI